ncbi:MAG: rRNA maturation RNase YbeY [Holosporales bacterium]|nr:rRNA maturation RNase YbeY [Holosporales bacterium]
MNKSKVNINMKSGDEWKREMGFAGWKESLSNVLNYTILKKYCDDSIAVEIDLQLINDAKMKILNSKFMKKNAITNILSFPQFSASDVGSILRVRGYILGDIFLAYGKIMQESHEFKIPFFDRCTHLFVHGVLHLIGMDHALQPEEEEMENLEICILEEFGIRNPYIMWES